MKTLLKIVVSVIVIIPLAALGWLFYSTPKNLATATPDAIAALTTDATVRIESGDWLVMHPGSSTVETGIILYPGANCDIRGYAPVLRKVAAQGYLVVAVSMPFDFAIFAPSRADDVRAAFPEIDNWVIAGHSMGGAMAGQYAFQHQQELAGLVLWDAYPPGSSDLSESTLPTLHVHRATADGTPPQTFVDMLHLFPNGSQWVPVPGGQHMYFGSFDGGAYKEEWQAGIKRDVQQAIVTTAMLDWLAERI